MSTNVTSSTAALFVGPLGQVPDLCNTNWNAVGSAVVQPGCKYQLTTSSGTQHGEIVWPTLVATDNIVLSFTVTLSNPSATPADGFTVVLGDPSLGATPTSTGATGFGLGAQGIPGLVFGFDTYHNAGDPPVPYVAVGRGETNLFENPWFMVNTNIPQLVSASNADFARLHGDADAGHVDDDAGWSGGDVWKCDAAADSVLVCDGVHGRIVGDDGDQQCVGDGDGAAELKVTGDWSTRL